MDMTAFAQSVVRAADAGQLTLLPISKRDASNGCMVRFRLGSPYMQRVVAKAA